MYFSRSEIMASLKKKRKPDKINDLHTYVLEKRYAKRIVNWRYYLQVLQKNKVE